ncbi:MAG: hypothetical protein AB1540_00740 [Bdellovibrionota bacterium]
MNKTGQKQTGVDARSLKQAAHDLGSPVAALKMLCKNARALTDEERQILQGSIERIEIVARKLSEYAKNK